MTPLCCFKRCSRAAMAGKPHCEAHKKKRLCSSPGCQSMVNKHSLCVRHGARKGQCSVSGCGSLQRRVGDRCYKHATPSPLSSPAIEPAHTTACTRHHSRNEAMVVYGASMANETPLSLGLDVDWDSVVINEEFQGSDDYFDGGDIDLLDDEDILKCLLSIPACSNDSNVTGTIEIPIMVL
ncbi:Aste57867_19888 [Aphanomyces stellatus]|uniref:Aste57867_19888 protein n=1 Tax=Aphanomyces stellatus TaxID=120398 RepID=A0A485LDJ5_9STRA|nr:hypothetical protein As57867_019822 [Aphanomyces stellatus]VFT96586.1 Aste57867_19888 [Aphanomyces stellatus]